MVIVGRKKWILDKNFRNNHYYKKAKWVDEFDDEIKLIALEDQDKPLHSRRVALMPNEIGTKKAQEIIESKNVVINEIEKMINEKKLPPAFQEKMRKNIHPNKTFLALSDLTNYANARIESGSDLTIYPWTETHSFLSSKMPLDTQTCEDEKSRKLIESMIKIMSRIESFPEVTYLNEFLKKNYRQELINWLSNACKPHENLINQDPELGLNLCLEESINQGLLKKSKLDWILPKSLLRRGISATGSAVSFLTLFLNPTDLVGWAAFTIGTIPVGLSILERINKIPLSSESYQGPRWPFICTTGKNAYYSEIHKLLTKLRKA